MEKESGQKRTLTITESTGHDAVTVSVRDQGPGIDLSIQDKIFKPFVTTRKEGMGIGLALSHSIIDDHQGKIWASNLPGGGAEFAFSLKTVND